MTGWDDAPLGQHPGEHAASIVMEYDGTGRIVLDPVVHYPGRYHVDGDGRRPFLVAVAADGDAHCACGGTSLPGEQPGCDHIAYVRRRQAEPSAVAVEEVCAMWRDDEAWRPDPERRAAWSMKAIRRLQDAAHEEETRAGILRRIREQLGQTPEERDRALEELWHRLNGTRDSHTPLMPRREAWAAYEIRTPDTGRHDG